MLQERPGLQPRSSDLVLNAGVRAGVHPLWLGSGECFIPVSWLWESRYAERGKSCVLQVPPLGPGSTFLLAFSWKRDTATVRKGSRLGSLEIQQRDLFLLLSYSSARFGRGTRQVWGSQLRGRLMGIKELSSASTVRNAGVPAGKHKAAG